MPAERVRIDLELLLVKNYVMTLECYCMYPFER